MAKLTKVQAKAHAEAVAILTKEKLTEDERDYVLENWHPGANHVNGAAGAFFTPQGLAGDFAIDAQARSVIDLCAGIGMLSYWIRNRSRCIERLAEITCIEINPAYVEVGKKIMPEARWICADVFNWRTLDLGRYDCAIANPPFGRVKRAGDGPCYRGPEFEFHVIDIASKLAERGVFLIPQHSASFRYSGARYFERMEKGRGVEFERVTGLEMDGGCGVDTSFYRDQWQDVSPLCEIVCIDFEAKARVDVRETSRPVAIAADPAITEQLALF